MRRKRIYAGLSVMATLALICWLGARLTPTVVQMPSALVKGEASQTNKPVERVLARVVYLPPPPMQSRSLEKMENSAVQPLQPLLSRQAQTRNLSPLTKRAPKPLKPAMLVVPLEPTIVTAAPFVSPLKSAPQNPEPVKPPGKISPQSPKKNSSGLDAVPADWSEPKALSKGWALLRMLEHSSGPSIEIAWPDNAVVREQLHSRLRDCYGMNTALMRRDGTLFVAKGPPGQPWSANFDLFSGFVRKPRGRLSTAEKHQVRAIRAHHPNLRGAVPVRLFPRRVDALLLAGLKAVAGRAYGEGEMIRARYNIAGGRVVVEDIRLGGRTAAGRIDMSPSARRCSRLD